MTPQEIDVMLKPILLKDLRIICRARALSPAGGRDQLVDRLKENMLETGNFTITLEDGTVLGAAPVIAGQSTEDVTSGHACNNYSRPSGQNVGNFITERPSSRVLAAPGGGSQICLGDYTEPAQQKTKGAGPQGSGVAGIGAAANNNNNYARPGGQNVGNFITDRHTVKVAAPPGGQSQIIFG